MFGLAAMVMPANAQQIIQDVDQQGYGHRTEPLYPYVTQPPQHVQQAAKAKPAPAAQAAKADPVMIDELRKRAKPKAAAKKEEPAKPEPDKKIDKTVVVREKPIVRKTYRVVEHPPVVVQREVSEDQVGAVQLPSHAQDVPSAGRIIRAEAEVTIIGPDRMSIRLYRKRDGGDANAEAEKLAPKRKRDARADGKSKIR